MGLIFGLLVISVLIVLFTKLFFENLSKYFWNESKNHFNSRDFKKKIGVLFITYAASGLIGFFIFVLFKSILTLSAYFLSSDLIEFFVRNRGVFTLNGINLQNPGLFKNIIYGLLITPLAQFFSVYVVIYMVKAFMLSLNSNAKATVFTMSDLVYFSTIACLCLMLLDIFVYYQSITLINNFTNVVLQVGAKFAYLLYLFTILHIIFMKNSSYSSSLATQLVKNKIEDKALNNPSILVLIVIIIGILLQLPLYSGFQFSSNKLLIIIKLFAAGVFLYFILSLIFAKGFNYIGIYLIHVFRNEKIDSTTPQFNIFNNKLKYSLGIILVILLILIPKSLFFFFFFIVLFSVIAALTMITSYCVGTLISGNKVKFKWETCSRILKSLKPVLILSVFYPLFVVFTVLSMFPKKLSVQKYSHYQTNVVDSLGNLLYISSLDNNPSSPVSFKEIPEFFVRVLMAKEDRYFMNQNSLMFNKTNWHGISLTGHSNLNQQVIKNLAFNGWFPQEIQRKLTEFFSSYQLSLHHSPESIITHYINNISFNGGKNHKGIVNGSLYTFGKNVNQLNELEMIYLIMTLHRGTDFKIYNKNSIIDSELTSLLERKKIVNENLIKKDKAFRKKDDGDYLVVKSEGDNTFIKYEYIHLASQTCKNQLLIFADIWHDEGFISHKEFARIKKQKLNFSNKPYKLKALASTNSFYKKKLNKYQKDYISFHSNISLQKQLRTNQAASLFFRHFDKQKTKSGNKLYAAALVVDVKTGKILAHYGGEGISDLVDFKNGNPMGSVIKPFVLLQLLEHGHIINLYDGKRKGIRGPNNYNNKNSNRYKNESQILGPSLNTVFGNIYETTDPIVLFINIESKFSEMGIRIDKYLNLKDSKKETEYRIGYPIGSSRNMTLYGIAQTYQTVFNNGLFKPLTVFYNRFNPYTLNTEEIDKKSSIQIYKRENIYRIQDALKTVLEPGGTGYHLNKYLPDNVQFMAKTGTTDEYRHGYTVLSDGETLVVSWVSYGKIVKTIIKGKTTEVLKLGQAAIPNNSGGGSAGVLAAYIMREISK